MAIIKSLLDSVAHHENVEVKLNVSADQILPKTRGMSNADILVMFR